MTDVTWTITPGRVRVSEDPVDLIVDHDDVKIWEINLDSKYPSDGFHSFGPEVDRHSVFILADERTLRLAETEDDTVFDIRGLDGNWTLISEPGKYAIRVVAYWDRRIDAQSD